MKKKFITSTPVFKRYFLVWFLLMGFTRYINAQPNIDFALVCPNPADTFASQVKGEPIDNNPASASKWAIHPITAIHPPGGGAITMSITNIDATSPAVFNICSGSACASPFTVTGITFTISGSTLTISGTPTTSPITYAITVSATVGATTCQRTYTLKVYTTVEDRGDPHLTTADGEHYDFQAVGEFIVLQGDGKDGFEIQTRQKAVATNNTVANSHTGLATCVSLNAAVAARVGTHRVTYQPNINGSPDSSGMQLRVDGELTKLGDDGIDLGSGGRIVKAGDGIEIDFPNGASLVAIPNWWSTYGVWYLNVDVYRTMAARGIMGVIAPRSWLPALPDGTSLGPRPDGSHERFVQLYSTFADAWRVTDKTSLFDYLPGTSTDSFTNKNWPAEFSQSCSIPNHTVQPLIARGDAEQLCRDIVDLNQRENAIFDVMFTGEASFAKAYLASQQIKNGTTETTVNASKDTTKSGETVTFTATVERKFVRGKDMLTGSVEFTVDGKKSEQVKLDANGVAILTTTSLEVGQHKIAAKFIPDSGSTASSSSSPDVTHVVTGATGITEILHQWWFWVALIVLLLILFLLFRKKKP